VLSGTHTPSPPPLHPLLRKQATLLFLALAVLPARTVNTRAKGATAASLPPGARQSTSNNSGAGLPGRVVYSVVIDAGSTGSRVHVFRFKQDRRTRSLRLLGELFLPTHPGLSSFSGDPRAAALSLKPLMGAAVKAVPPDLRPATALTLRATAGLRLLPAAKADAVLRVRRCGWRTGGGGSATAEAQEQDPCMLL
jgi:Golgi nucleoside diphosphatase